MATIPEMIFLVDIERDDDVSMLVDVGDVVTFHIGEVLFYSVYRRQLATIQSCGHANYYCSSPAPPVDLFLLIFIFRFVFPGRNTNRDYI